MNQFLRKALLRDVTMLWIMALIAVGCGLAINQLRDAPLPWVYASKAERLLQAIERLGTGTIEHSQSAHSNADSVQGSSFTAEITRQGAHDVGQVDLATLCRMQESALILDARPEIFHRFGHIPGALSLPRDDFEAFYSKQRNHLEKYKLLPVVIYCSGINCEDGDMVATALSRLGFVKLHIFQGGWHEWQKAGLPEEQSR